MYNDDNRYTRVDIFGNVARNFFKTPTALNRNGQKGLNKNDKETVLNREFLHNLYLYATIKHHYQRKTILYEVRFNQFG